MYDCGLQNSVSTSASQRAEAFLFLEGVPGTDEAMFSRHFGFKRRGKIASLRVSA